MLRKIIVFTLLLSMLLQGAVYAQTMGEVVFRDALYGAVLGGVLGTALYLANDDEDKEFLSTIGVGVALGTMAGAAFGVAVDAKSMAEIDGRGVKFALPSPALRVDDGAVGVSASLLKVTW